MKVLLAQINTTPRDFSGNLESILKGIREADSGKADLVVFPEAAIPGYLAKDLVYNAQFMDQNLLNLQRVVEYSRTFNCHIVVGYFDYNRNGWGKPFRNMAAVIHKGMIVGTYQKQLLPFYDVFDEGRYFQPGEDLCVFKINGEKWGVCICEDVWNDKGQDDYNYDNNPLARYRKLGVDNIISLNSSPFTIGKPARRRDMLELSSRAGGKIIYVNQKGGQDELIFDGHSLIAQEGVTIFQADASSLSHNDYFLFDLKENKTEYGIFVGKGNYDDTNKYKCLKQMLVLGLRDYVRKSGFTQIVIGESGGIDSAVVTALAAEALGARNVHAIMMPSVEDANQTADKIQLKYSSQGSIDDAKALIKNIGCWGYFHPICVEQDTILTDKCFRADPVDMSKNRNCWGDNLVALAHRDGKCNPVADENRQARKRGEIVMYFSNKYGALALTTGNKTEIGVGYCTLYGDMNGGFAPINDLLKMDVYGLAKHINEEAKREIIPNNIITKAPSAELAPDQADEKSLLPYPILDRIVSAYIHDYISELDDFITLCDDQCKVADVNNWGLKPNAVSEEYTCWDNCRKWAKTDPTAKEQYARMIRLTDRSEFKRRQAAPGLKVHTIAFGTGRRLPIVKG